MPRIAVRAWWFVAFATTCALIATFAQPLTGAQNPSLLFSTPITGGLPVRIAVDAQGFIYLAGKSSGPYPAPSFVMKLTPSRSVVYTTYLQGPDFSANLATALSISTQSPSTRAAPPISPAVRAPRIFRS